MDTQTATRSVRVSVADLQPNFETGTELTVVESHLVDILPSDDLRTAALNIYDRSGSRDVGVGGEESHFYIEVSLMPAGWVAGRALHLAAVSTIGLAISRDGAILFSDSRSQTFGDLERLASLGLQDGDPAHLVAYFRGGRGDDPGELLEAINQIANHLLWFGIDSTVAWLGGKSLRRFWRRRGLRSARLIATDWAQRGLASSEYLREFLERKSSWDVAELSNLLRIKRRQTRRLLSALGFERDARGVWRVGQSPESRSRRESWVRDEARVDWWTAIQASPSD